MTFSIDPSRVQFTQAGAAHLQGGAQDAKDLLQSLAVSLTNGNGVKSGYLRIATANQGGSQSLEVGRRRWGGGDASTQRATALVKALVSKAYGDQPAVRQALESYLQKSGNRMGTQSFMRLVQSLASEQERASGAGASQRSQELSGVRAARSARLNTQGFDASADVRHKVDSASVEAGQTLAQSNGAQDPVAMLATLTTQYQSLSDAIAHADAAGMNVDALTAQLHDLNQQVVHLQPRAQQVQALVADTAAEIARMAQSEWGELRQHRDSALQMLAVKARELNHFSAAFHQGQAGAGGLDAASQRHAQLSEELETARAVALKACDDLTTQAQAHAATWKQELKAGFSAQQGVGYGGGWRLESAIDSLVRQEAKSIETARAEIAQIRDHFGPPDRALADHVSNDRLSEAYARLRELQGDGAALAMLDIARAWQPAMTEPDPLASFAARAFAGDPSPGREVARWLREVFNPQVGGPAARESMLQALTILGQLDPGLAREAIVGLGLTGQPLDDLKKPPQSGTEFHFRPTKSGNLRSDIPFLDFALERRDLQGSVGMIEGHRVELRGAQLAGSHLVFKPQKAGAGGDRGLVFNLSAAASLPAQVRIDFSDARAAFDRVKPLSGERELVQTLIAHSGEHSLSEQRQNGLLRMIERLPADRPDLKTAMMGDVLQFFHDTRSTNVAEAWGPTVTALVRDPVYLADPRIVELLATPPLSAAWGRALLGQTFSSSAAVEAAVSHIERAPEQELNRLMRQGGEMFNQLFSFADGLDTADPLKQRVAVLEQRFLNAPPQREIMKALALTSYTFQGEDGLWKFEPGSERRLLVKGDLYLSTPVANFDKLLKAPDRLNWTGFQLMRPKRVEGGERLRDTDGDIALEFATGADLAGSMPALRGAFPLLQQAYETLPSDGATEVLGMIFAAEEADGLRQQLVEALRMTGNAPSPAELSVSLLPYLEPVMRFKDENGAAGPAGVSRAHYEQLLDHAAAQGFAGDAASFARYLHCLSISFAFLSSDGGLGNSSESVHSLRMYALALHRESMHLSGVAPDAFKGYESQMEGVDKMFTAAGQCGHELAGQQAVMVKKLDVRLAASVMPARLIGDNLAQVVGDGGDTEEIVAEQARNAALVRGLRGQGGDDEPAVRAPMQFGQGALVGEGQAAAVDVPDFSRPDFLETELIYQLDQLGPLAAQLGAGDPIVRFTAAAAVQAAFAPLGTALETALDRVDAELNQALQALDDNAKGIAAEQPAPGLSQLDMIRFNRGKQDRLAAIPEEAERARAKAARQQARVETVSALLQASAAVLAQGPSQAG